MTYARSRLWLGISGVGLVVVLSSGALWFDLPHRLLPGLSGFAAIALTLLLYVCISIPSDVLGGYLLPRRHHRTQITPWTFLAAWSRGVLTQALVLGIGAAAILAAGRSGGTGAGIACFALLMLLLLTGQSLIARIAGGFTQVSPDVARVAGMDAAIAPSTIFRSSDPGFVGGLVGLPGAERLVVPDTWQRKLAPYMLATELTRRRGAIATGARTRGLVVAICWNLAGFSLACRMPGSSVRDASGLVQCALWFTLWSFAGLLLLPSVNRPAVLELDRFALNEGVPAELITETILRLDGLQDDEPSRTKWVERVFHPVPSVEQRLAALSHPRERQGGWQCARTALYLSWACFGFLSRAVHCNAGRPELWVLFPSD